MLFAVGDLRVEVSTFLIVLLGVGMLLILARWRRRRVEKKRTKETDGTKVAHATSVASVHKRNAVAVVSVMGPILSDPGASPFRERATATHGFTVRDILLAVAKHRQFVGALIQMTTPGGTVGGSFAIAEGIEACRKAGKKVVVHVTDLAASGGVLAMVGADRILAERGSLIGSIGVVGPTLLRFEDVRAMHGAFGAGVDANEIRAYVLSVGKGKTLGNPFVEPEQDVIDNLNGVLERMYEQFRGVVSRSRGIQNNKLLELGAQLVDVDQARTLRLIDGTGTREDARQLLGQLLSLPSDALHYVQIRQSVFGRLDALLDYVGTLPFASARAEQAVAQELAQQPVLLMSPRFFRS